MEKNRYKITCRKCKADRVVDITKTAGGEFIDWLEDKQPNSKIISARPRLDGQWGFQCLCGSNDLMTKQEERTIKNPQNPKAQEIDEIVKNLKQEKPLFEMVRA